MICKGFAEPASRNLKKVNMANDSTTTKPESVKLQQIRLWPLWLLALISLWCLFGPTLLGMADYLRFFTLAIGALVQVLALVLWGLLASGLQWRTRVGVLVVGIAVLVAAFALQHRSLGISILLYGVPLAIIVVAVVGGLTVNRSWPDRRWLLCAAWALPILAWLPLRSEGYKASFMPQLRWRWTPDAESIAMKKLESEGSKSTGERNTTIQQVTFKPGDWPRFRGASNNGQASGEVIETSDKPSIKKVWSKVAGPSWGSVIAIDGWLYTIEQRGADEAIICLNASDGHEVWAAKYPARFEDKTQVSGVGPRGTPTFHNGILYSVGATGHITAVQATDGKMLWQRELIDDTRGSVPEWGFSTSPFVDDNYCIIMSNSAAGKTIDTICYDTKTGNIIWTGEEGGMSYSSPHVVELFGIKQVLVSLTRVSGEKKGNLLLGRDYATGKELWRFEGDATGNAMLTPLVVGANQIIIADGAVGVTLLELSYDEGKPDSQFSIKASWRQNRLLPEFSDLVVEGDMVLGLSKGLLTALDLTDGKLLWKKFRFGGGQLIGVSKDQTVLVISEEGRLSLIRVSSKGPELLCEFDGVQGKTWNHPVVVGNRIYCRNAEEIACLEFSTPGS